METSFLNRLQALLLGLVTVGLVSLAVLNFMEERRVQLPDDGVWWREAANGAGLVADKVLPDSPGKHAGIREGDLLTGVNILPVGSVGPGLPGRIRSHEPLPGVRELADQSAGSEQLALSPEVKFSPITSSADLERALYRTGNYFQIYYKLTRKGVAPGALAEVVVDVIPEPMDRSLALG